MSFLAPMFLVAGAAVAAMVIALHLIARQRPRSAPLPTARFIPERQVRAPSRSIWPTDLLLLALRVSIVLLASAAFARPMLRERRSGTARVVVADVSRAVAALPEVADSARAVLRDGDVLISFDTTARVSRLDSIASRASGRPAPGSLSAALVAAIRQGRRLASRAESLELIVVSPLVEEEWDAATDSIRALWPGRVRLVPVGIATSPIERRRIAIRAEQGDPLVAALPDSVPYDGADVRIVRQPPTAGDSSWADDAGGVVLDWPASQGQDSSGGVLAGQTVVVAPFSRRPLDERRGHVLARWADGEPAAIERAVGRGCVREIGIGVPERGDLVLRAGFRRLVRQLAAACGGTPALARLDSARLARLAAAPARVAAAGIATGNGDRSRLAALLLAGALLLALAELLLRRQGTDR